MKRREFLKKGVACIGAVIVGGNIVTNKEVSEKPEPKLETITISGSGMYDGEYYMPQGMSDAIVREIDSTHLLRKYNV